MFQMADTFCDFFSSSPYQKINKLKMALAVCVCTQYSFCAQHVNHLIEEWHPEDILVDQQRFHGVARCRGVAFGISDCNHIIILITMKRTLFSLNCHAK